MSKKREAMGVFAYLTHRADRENRHQMEERIRRKEKRFGRTLRDDEFTFDGETAAGTT